MMHGKRQRIIVGLVAGGIGLVLFGGHGLNLVSAVDRSTYEDLEAFTNVLAIVQKNYVEETETQALIEGAINGMLRALDPHSAYLTPDSYQELQVDTEGSFGGLGIEITTRDDILTIVSPIEDTPAYRAGVQAGDQIIKINGELTKDMSLIQAVKKMRGKQGTQITISVRREDVPRLIDISLIREVIKIRSVKSKTLEKGYAYIRVTQFQDRTSSDLDAVLKKLNQENGQLQGMVLDLRNNPGGLLSQAVKVSDLFLSSGMIVYTEGRLESQKQKYFAHPGGYTDIPLVVLVNGGSASASEIVAGAVQDHGRAVLLGTKTFGKGSVQTILPVEGGAALRLTTAMYFTPNGRSIQVTGIAPDIELENVPEAYAAASRRHGVREENLRGHFDNISEHTPQGKSDDGPADAAAESQALPEVAIKEGEMGKDPQLDRALELLKSWKVFQTTVAEAQGQ
jgi:carboxyl-terminal processing protease